MSFAAYSCRWFYAKGNARTFKLRITLVFKIITKQQTFIATACFPDVCKTGKKGLM